MAPIGEALTKKDGAIWDMESIAYVFSVRYTNAAAITTFYYTLQTTNYKLQTN